MERSNNEVLDITLPEARERSLAGVFFKITALPIAVFAVFLLGYLGLIGLKVETHSILMLAVHDLLADRVDLIRKIQSAFARKQALLHVFAQKALVDTALADVIADGIYLDGT